MSDPRSEQRREQVFASLTAAGGEDLNVFTQVAEAGDVERELDAALNESGSDARESGGALSGALRGRALAVKDNIHVAGMRNTAGTPALRDFMPAEDASAVKRLRREGLVVIGKTNMHELALGVTGCHTATGPMVNPVDRTRVTGGSSGGSAAIVAAGICDLTLGSDTGGSTRVPAAYTDVWGYRPTTGRYDTDGGTSLAFSRDTIGPMTGSLADIIALDSALARTTDTAVIAPVARIGFDPAELDVCDEPVAEAFRAALEALGAAEDCELVEVPMDALNRSTREVESRLGPQELAPSLGSYLASSERLPSLERVIEQVVDPHVAFMLEGSLAATAEGVWTEAWHRVLVDVARVRTAYQRMLGERGIVATLRPTAPILPPRIAEVLAMSVDQRNELFARTTHFAGFATVIGAPSLSLPLGRLLGHSMTGLMVETAPACDIELLHVGRRIEAALRG